jgi:micrococcal nuclease
MNSETREYWHRHTRRRRIQKLLARLSVVPTALVACMIGALGVVALQQTDFGEWLETAEIPDVMSAIAPRQAPLARAETHAIDANFGTCSGSIRITCVVDGDTFWLDGTKYRIADINTPEVSSPQCAHEAQLGRRATERLTQLLNAGPFMLAHTDRDEDRYGRKLRVVERDGRSIGMALVAEGLAEEWQGRRQSWC